ncbi:MAG TPA: GMC family oxidoreductase [Thermoanaerobaculia bacterium]|nr:GMC family oxidoreductase [Thermoanaerobaculia bacterium]
MTRLTCDVLIIGSGAAGGVLAATLSELTSKKIVVVEKGAWYGSEFFDQREWDMRVLYAGEGRRTTVDGAMPVRGGECVGGGTTVNYALCFDPVEPVWKGWQRDYGLTGFSFDAKADDYGVAGLNVPSALDEVRKRINVHRAADEEVNDNNRALERGCAALGIPSQRFELNMRGCVRSGFCGEGCSYGAKQGTLVTYMADALARGVQLIHHCDIEGLVFEKRRGALTATAANGRVRRTRRGSRPNSAPAGRIEIEAKLIIVAAGAVATPALLQRSRHPDPYHRIGRGLVTHPSLPIIGVMDHELSNYRGIPGTVYSDAFVRSHRFYFETLFGQPVYGSLVIPGIGAEHFDVLSRLPRLIGFGAMLIDDVDERNRVEWSAGDGQPRIHYQLTDDDRGRLRFAAQRGIEIMFAAGARTVMLPSSEKIGPLPQPRFSNAADARHCSDLHFEPHRTTLTSAHAQATTKMGEDQRRTTASSRGESHGVRNLIICDSSSFPSSCGANPMLSIMTMARYQGRRIAAELARYEM